MPDLGSSRQVLPDYANPPIAEVIFAVAVTPLPISVVDLARFGLERLADQFPVHQDQPPALMAVESFDDPLPNLAPALALLTGAPPIRLWFQSEDRTRLVQLQRDWLAYNWQGASGDRPYPRYGYIEGRFLETLDAFAEFARDVTSQELVVHQCELSYVNYILPSDLWQRHGQASEVIRLVGASGEFLPEPEDAQIAFRYRIVRNGQSLGRLYVQATPGQRPTDRQPAIQLNVTARGEPTEPSREGMLDFFRLAHEWIVEGFSAVTTDRAQTLMWGRTK
jgi:uncharacterized protein (TIGR04255 family)